MCFVYILLAIIMITVIFMQRTHAQENLKMQILENTIHKTIAAVQNNNTNNGNKCIHKYISKLNESKTKL